MRPVDGYLRPFLTRLAFCAAVLVPSVAAAAGVAPNDATPAQKKQATDRFAAGKQALEAKNWEKATLELRASLEVVDSPNARLVLARTLRDSGNTGEAWAEYGLVIESATKLAANEPRYAQTSDAATSERAELEPKLAFVTVAVANASAGATLKVGGRAVPARDWIAPVVVPAGAVDVVLSGADGKELARQTVSATVGQKTAVSLDAQPPPPPRPAGKAPLDTDDKDKQDEVRNQAVVVPPPSSGSRLRPYAYIAGGVGIAGFATFGIFGLMDKSTYGDLQNACPHNVCPPGKQGEVDSGRTQQTVANVGLVVGAVGLAGGATLFLLSPAKASASPSARLIVGPGYLGVGGSL
jgi:hypothetical protein